jgi:alkanesulfonate monooxygenase SsuD/methylene tetrahydromethanopterin reductase-like flavin-dependent oxidoreductase (luciferase family)
MLDDAPIPPQFGLNIDPLTRDLDMIFRLSSFADEAGLDFISIQDHPYIPNFLETWTLLTAIGARTTKVRLLPNVLCLPLRPPSVLAKSAATLDLITGGRVELGLGAGAFWDGIAGYGGRRRSPGEAVEALEEAIEVCMGIWSQEGADDTVSVDGEHYHLDNAKPGPTPAHDIGIWLGALGPRMLRLTGRAADGWIVSTGHVPPQRLPEMQATIDDSARDAGRSPGAIRRAYNVGAYITTDGEPVPSVRPGTIVGPAESLAGEIASYYSTHRMDTFLFRAGGGDVEEQARRFARNVVPDVLSRIG